MFSKAINFLTPYIYNLTLVNIFFLIGTLKQGGAERQLVELVKGLDKEHFDITVALFYNEGELREELFGLRGVRLLSLSKSGRWDLIGYNYRLIRILMSLKPDVLYSFLPEPNIIGLVVGKLAMVPKIVWGIRASNVNMKHYNWLVGASTRISAWLSRFPNTIIVNSFKGFLYHEENGYATKNMIVIPNGINTKRFVQDQNGRLQVRSEWGIDEEILLIGRVGRLDPMKDYETFLRAAQIFVKHENRVCFVCVGDGPETYKNYLYNLCKKLGLDNKVLWVSSRHDMSDVYNAFDIFTSSSAFGEGFPNVIGEAMACGVPCVVTDVGDSAKIVGDTGEIVATKEPLSLSEGWLVMLKRLEKESNSMAKTASLRINDKFSSETMVKMTSEVLLGLGGGKK